MEITVLLPMIKCLPRHETSQDQKSVLDRLSSNILTRKSKIYGKSVYFEKFWSNVLVFVHLIKRLLNKIQFTDYNDILLDLVKLSP